MASGIYEIVSASGKRYVGSAVDFAARWRCHRYELRRGKHHSSVLQRAWNKYGEQAFEFRKLLICKREDLLFYEQLCLDGLKPEYNCTFIVGPWPTAKTWARASEVNRGNKYCLGRKHSDETRAKIAAAVRGNTNVRGRKLTAEHKAKIGEANRRASAAKRAPT